MKTNRFKTRQRGMILCRGTAKLKTSDLEKEKKKRLSEIHRTATKAALEKQKAAKKKE